jgi:hypothetical protein
MRMQNSFGEVPKELSNSIMKNASDQAKALTENNKKITQKQSTVLSKLKKTPHPVFRRCSKASAAL